MMRERQVLTRLLLVLLVTQALAGSPQTTYFPEEFKAKSSIVAWYARNLNAMNEPSLLQAAQDSKAQTYRFLWLRSFHEPIAIRLVVRDDKSGVIVFRRANREPESGYEPGRLIEDRATELSREQVEGFLWLLNNEKFWKLPSLQEEDDVIRLDGAQWIIEGVKNRKYHIVDRWSPEKGPVRVLAMRLIQLSGFRPYYDEVY